MKIKKFYDDLDVYKGQDKVWHSHFELGVLEGFLS